MKTNAWSSRLRRVALVGALALATAFAPLVVAPAPAQAAPVTGFNPGNIISDSLFYNGNAMTASEVQSFLNQRVTRCTIGDPGRAAGSAWGNTTIASKCLRNFSMNTTTKAANANCAAYTGRSGETAAEIITRVGQACGISQKVLLVMLEKEQSLVSDTWPTVRQFDVAMGYACPDSGPGNSANCDMTYAGFFNQVYLSAWQLKNYKLYWNTFSYKPFQNNSIQWHPNAGCGSSTVYIENWATAALYIYTPYRPNQAALNAGWGTGDGCSSYGNRNFYLMYTTWFGSTGGIAVPGVIGQKYMQLGGAQSWLGAPAQTQSCDATGVRCWQQFTNGRIYSTYAGAFIVRAEFYTLWNQQPDAMRALGSPISDPSSTGSSYTQTFEGGAITVTNGVPAITSSQDPWTSAIIANPWLGSSTNAKTCAAGNRCWQQFTNGRIYSTSAGAFATRAEFITLWNQQPDAMRALGSPISDPSSTGSSYTQTFEGGAITVTNGVPAITSSQDPWTSAIIANPWLGSSTNAKTCAAGNRCWQQFTNGRIYSTSAGAFATRAEFITLWNQQPDAMRALGSPISDPSSTGSSYTQTFEGGAITVTNGVPAITSSQDPWTSAIIANPWLGSSTNAKTCAAGNRCWQQFTNGRIYSTSAGAFATRAEFITLWNQQPDAMRALGSPISDPSSTGSSYTQTFEGGAITVTNGVPAITSSQDPWTSAIIANPWLGSSTNAKTCAAGNRCWQQFTNGRIYSTSAGAFATRAEFITLWNQQPDAMRALGSPISDPSSTGSSYTQTFEGGAITVTNGVPAITSSQDPWTSAIIANPWLGSSTNAKTCAAGNRCWQQFTNGRIYSTSAGAFATRAEFITLWNQQPDAMRALGSPISDPSSTGSSYTQTFEGGAITVTNGVPAISGV